MDSKSKKWFGGMLVGWLSAVVLMGCAGEDLAYEQPIKVNFQGKFSCFDTAEETMTKYFSGVLQVQEVEQFWDCMDFAIRQFVVLVKGKETSLYTAAEIAKFLDDYFLKGRDIHLEQEFLLEMMHLKRLFVGGALEFVSHHDLTVETRRLIAEFKAISIELNPHMSTLSHGVRESSAKSGLDPGKIKSAEMALRQGALRLGRLVSDRQQPYSFTRLLGLITQFEKLIKKEEPDFNFDLTKEYLPLFAEIKGVVIGPPSDEIQFSDWVRIFDVVSAVVGWTMSYRLEVQDRNWSRGDALAALASISDGVFQHLGAGLDGQPQGRLEFSRLDRLVDQLDRLKLLPLGLGANAVKALLRPLAEKILVQDDEGGLSRADLSALKVEVDRWFEAQRLIDSVIEDQSAGNALLETQTLARLPDSGASEMLRLLEASRGLEIDSIGRLVFPAAAPGLSESTMTTLNWQRALIRVFVRGYGPPSAPHEVKGLSERELFMLAKDWEELAVPLGLFEPGQAERAAGKILLEANLFLPSSNGDASLDFFEGVHYLTLAISGLFTVDEIFESLKSDCVNSDGRLEASCYRSALANDFSRFLPNFSGLGRYLMGGGERWLQAEMLLEKAIRSGGYSDKPLARGELVSMLVLVQFMEIFLARFDANDSQTVNVPETLEAFPVFRSALKSLIRKGFGVGLSDDQVRALFTYLFRYGRPPQADFGGALKFLNWMWREPDWSYDVDRMRILQILAELNALR